MKPTSTPNEQKVFTVSNEIAQETCNKFKTQRPRTDNVVVSEEQATHIRGQSMKV